MASSSDNVRALSRGLNILRFLNRAGAARVAEIASELNLPRPTVYRLLHTLEEDGYVLYSGSNSRVRLSPLAAALGDSSSMRSQLCQVAAPIINKFTDIHAWPVSVTTYKDGHMVIEESTHNRSPLSVDTGMEGYSLPMLRTSDGRVYLSACSKSERKIIIDLIRAEGLPEDLPFLQKNWLDENLTEYFEQGFATRSPPIFRLKTSTLSVPILASERLLGCLSIVWVTKAMKLEDGVESYAILLQKAAKKIASELLLQKTTTDINLIKK